MKILVGLSGGVDSAVSAYLLKNAGHEVHAGFMINYLTDDPDCTTRADLEIAREVAAFLDIPFFTFDYREAYEARITSIIYEGYARGITPNPDVLCNNLIKFELFAADAREYWYDKIAMGHYARIGDDKLLKGVDPLKDQSYFLSRLSPEQLAFALFPIGHLTKAQVRKIALAVGLPNALRKDSQGLCFIGKVKIQDFLGSRIDEKYGDILDTWGVKIGEHQGIHRYTIGQRRGIEVGGGPALFVVSKNATRNTLIVGPENTPGLFTHRCIWVEWSSPSEIMIQGLIDRPVSGKIRYGQADQPCRILNVSAQWQVFVSFEVVQRAIAPGQYLVLYAGDELIGSLLISEASFVLPE